MTNVAQMFNTQAAAYDRARRRLIPPFESFYWSTVEALRLCRPAPVRVLDLGAGTGLLTRFVRAAYPQAEITLTDGAAKMLEKAQAEMGHERTVYVRADLMDPLPQGPWDAVVSALAIHHLAHSDKQELFRRIRAALRPGGVFVNAEQVAGPTPLFTQVYAEWHEAQARAAGSDDAEWNGAEGRMAFDRCADVEEQLAWLRLAGFTHADCLFKDHRFAVLAALAPGHYRAQSVAARNRSMLS